MSCSRFSSNKESTGSDVRFNEQAQGQPVLSMSPEPKRLCARYGAWLHHILARARSCSACIFTMSPSTLRAAHGRRDYERVPIHETRAPGTDRPHNILNFHANITPSTHLLDDLPDNALIFSVPFLQQQQHQIYHSASLSASIIAFTRHKTMSRKISRVR